jgi:hypothetical protein
VKRNLSEALDVCAIDPRGPEAALVPLQRLEFSAEDRAPQGEFARLMGVTRPRMGQDMDFASGPRPAGDAGKKGDGLSV